MNILLRSTSAGRRAEKLPDDEINKLLKAGAAVMIRDRIYEACEPTVKVAEPAPPLPHPVEESIVEEPSEYAHKAMTAKKPGRPPKAKV